MNRIRHLQATARFRFVAIQIAPLRAAVTIDESNTIVRLECGHAVNVAPHFSYAVGGLHNCWTCGELAASKLPEFRT